MTTLMIILAIVGFLAFIASIRFKITIEYNESLCVYLRILHIFRIAITPRKEKKIKISDYSEKAMTKRQKAMAAREAQKTQKKQVKKQQKLEKKKYKKEHPEEFQHERTLSEMQIYERTRRELEKESRPEIWEQKNESLRILGLRTIPAPNE